MMQTRALLAALRLGLYFALFCFLILHVGLQSRVAREEKPTVATPLPSSPTDEELAAASSSIQPHFPLLGVTVELDAFTAAEREVMLARLRAGGVGWVRQRFDWSQIEPIEGHFEWQTTDAVLTAIGQSGLIPVALLDGAPSWARDSRDVTPIDNALAPPSHPSTFARFAAAFANRYGTQLRYYQIWHEPNIAPHWGARHIEPVEYARLLAAAGNLIRAADPDAQIVAAALAPTADRGHTAIDEVYFLQRLYAASRKFDAPSADPALLNSGVPWRSPQPQARLFDVVTVQPFGFGHAPWDSRQQLSLLNFQRIALVHRVMVAAGDGRTPLWAVRFGWSRAPNSPWGSVSPQNQLRFAAQAVALADQWPWLAAMGWAIDQPATPSDSLGGFALNDRLLDALGAHEEIERVEMQATAHRWRIWPHSLWLLAPLILWRAFAAWRVLSRRRWSNHWQPLVHGWGYFGSGTVLAYIYFVATWPPLLALCWLAFCGLAWVAPLPILCAAAALLPFHFQHKEVAIVDWQWQIAPTQLLLTALLPALGRSCLTFWRAMRLQMHHRHPSLTETTDQRQAHPQWGALTFVRQCVAPHLCSFDVLALCWLLINLASTFNVWYWPAYWQSFFELALMPLLLYLSVRMWITTEDAALQLGLWLFTGGLLAALWGWSSWLQNGGVAVDGVSRLVGPHFSPNHTALYLERSLFLGIGLVCCTRGITRRVGFASTLLIALALLLTFSRGALLFGLPAGVAIFYLYTQPGNPFFTIQPRWRRRARWMGAAAGAVLLLSAWFFAERLTNSASVIQRVESWQAAWRLWLDYWLVGVGPGGFFWRYPAYTLESLTLDPNLRHPHNLWLEFATSWGAVGVAWLLSLLWLLWQRTSQLRKGAARCAPAPGASRYLSIGLLAGLSAGILHGQVDAFMTLADLAGWNWLALGLLSSAVHAERSQYNR